MDCHHCITNFIETRRHTAPQEQQGESPWLLPKAGSSGLQGPQGQQPQTSQGRLLQAVHSLGDQAGTGTQVVSGCLLRQRLFSGNEMVCTHTFYNMAGAGLLSIQITELPEALKRKPRKTRDRKNKRRTTLPSASPARPARPCWRPCLSSGLSMVNVSHRSSRRLPWTTEASLPTLLR